LPLKQDYSGIISEDIALEITALAAELGIDNPIEILRRFFRRYMNFSFFPSFLQLEKLDFCRPNTDIIHEPRGQPIRVRYHGGQSPGKSK
jgi:hypothetical protein